jgi:hypothetical protein
VRFDQAVPEHLDVHLIVDNYGTHKTSTIKRWLVNRPRFHLHFTPTGTSWINLVERWFALLTEKQIRRGVFRSTRDPETAIRKYLDLYNTQAKPFVWTKTAVQTSPDIVSVFQLQDSRVSRLSPYSPSPGSA